jgi:DNA repair exonuclease SbcCD ATPase subunit
MITIKDITIKNFMSIGNVTQAVRFSDNGLTLVLGNNMDLGGDGSRNGTGKTTIVNALSYAMYGNALTNIRKDNLINKTNAKGMLVTLDFEKNGTNYRIERGRRPNIFRFLVNDMDINSNDTDEAQGENRQTQDVVEKLFGMSHDMFKHIVALNTYTEPFLSMKANDQRTIIEQLLGITMLSEKAEVLREQQRLTKDAIKEEEYRIKAVEDANLRIEKSISDLERRQRLWESKKHEDLQSLTNEISILDKINIDQELAAHKELTSYLERKQQIQILESEITRLSTSINKEQTRLTKAQSDLQATIDHKCYACGQEIHDDQHEKILETKRNAVKESELAIANDTQSKVEYTQALADIGALGKMPITHYNTEQAAYQHQSKIEGLRLQYTNKANETDTYREQIDILKENGLQTVTWDIMNELSKVKEHQDFLYKLLTNKDSFIRKKIIEQNLTYLNSRLAYYLTKLGLPHEVQFISDLNVEITELGRELDFDNLSRGERNRLILGLSWAFRDVYESMNEPINFMAIDELIDSGMDTNGVDAALSVLKKIERERGKNIFLISHRDELVGRVNTILQVTKENGFTTFSTDTEYVSGS